MNNLNVDSFDNQEKKTKWASVPINKDEFLAKGYTIENWKKYNSEISTKGTIYVRREITIKE